LDNKEFDIIDARCDHEDYCTCFLFVPPVRSRHISIPHSKLRCLAEYSRSAEGREKLGVGTDSLRLAYWLLSCKYL
jgi:hypothetical protein